MQAEREGRLADICASQYGTISRQQLLDDIGVSGRTIKRLIETNRLCVVRQGIYRIAGSTPDIRTALYAATAGTRISLVSHRAATSLWHLPGGADLVEIASPRWRRVRGKKLCGFKLVVHESLHLSGRDAVEIDGIWRTKVPRTLVDLGASVALGHIDGATLTLAIQDAVRRNLTDVAQLEATFARLAPDIRIGARCFRDALDRFQPVLADAESSPEIKVGQALIAAGFHVIPQYKLRLSPTWTIRIDLYLPELHRGVEVNPDCTHGSAVQRQYDIARALRIRRLHGIEIDEVSDNEIDRGCPELIAMLRTLRHAAA